MKITTSLRASPPRLALPLALGLWILAVWWVVIAIGIAVDALGRRAEIPRQRERLARIEAEASRAKSAPVSLPSPEALARVRERVAAMNAVSGSVGLPASELLAWLEAHLPADAWLVSLHHQPRQAETRLVVEAASTEPLATFLRALEKEPRFAEALLLRQGVGRGASMVQFEIRIKERR